MQIEKKKQSADESVVKTTKAASPIIRSKLTPYMKDWQSKAFHHNHNHNHLIICFG